MVLEQGESLLLQRTGRQSEGRSTEKRVIREEAGEVRATHLSNILVSILRTRKNYQSNLRNTVS